MLLVRYGQTRQDFQEFGFNISLYRMTAPDGGLLMKQRRYRMSKVRCFTGQECVDWMCDRLRMLRPQALVLGDMVRLPGCVVVKARLI